MSVRAQSFSGMFSFDPGHVTARGCQFRASYVLTRHVSLRCQTVVSGWNLGNFSSFAVYFLLSSFTFQQLDLRQYREKVGVNSEATCAPAGHVHWLSLFAESNSVRVFSRQALDQVSFCKQHLCMVDFATCRRSRSLYERLVVAFRSR